MDENRITSAMRLLDFCNDIQDRDSILQNVNLAVQMLQGMDTSPKCDCKMLVKGTDPDCITHGLSDVAEEKRRVFSAKKCWHCDGEHATEDCQSAVTKRFVVGFAFLFGVHRTWVALMLKDHPKWLAGKFNGVGGKVEPGETSHQAMRREFLEETGVDTGDIWQHYCSIEDQRGWAIDFLHCELDAEQFEAMRNTTTEEISRFDLDDLPDVEHGLIPNLTWLIPMALSMKHEKVHWEGSTRMQVKSFKITEHGNRLEN